MLSIDKNEKLFWDNFYRSVDLNNEFSVSSPEFAHFSTGGQFFKLLGPLEGKKVLSIGGGIDLMGIYFSEMGAQVVSLDISETSCAETQRISKEKGVDHKIEVKQLS